MRLAFLLLLALASPGPAWAQAGPASSDAGRVSPTAGVLLKIGSIAGATRTHFGGWGGLMFSERLAVGGGGVTILHRVEIEGSEGGTGFSLDLGYGGLILRYWEPLAGPLVGQAGLLLGAGHAEVRDQLTRREVGSDNFLVSEAEMSVFYPLFSRLYLGVSGGYRLTAGVDDLPGVSPTDLDSFTATLSLRFLER